MRKQLALFMVCLLLMVSGLIMSAVEKKDGKQTENKMIILFNGKKVGFETYSFLNDKDGFQLEIKGKITTPLNLETREMIIKTDTNFHPVSFSWKVIANNVLKKIETSVDKGIAISWITVGGQSEGKHEGKIDDGALMMPNGVFSAIALLCKNPRFLDGSRKEFSAYLPERGMSFSVQVKRKQQVGEYYKYELLLVCSLVAEVVCDADGNLQSYGIPIQQIELCRSQYLERRKGKSMSQMLPTYADLSKFTETEVTFGKEPWGLPGTLSIPKGNGSYPAVVLVHGSGPNDRDETIFFNKPFRDLAYGLSSHGIAVLRYDKRTKVYPEKMASLKDKLTVKEELIDDALAAVDFLGRQPRIDRQRIFVLGHSLGGTCIPRIGLRGSGIAGLIIMAGAVRPIEDLILEQMQYIFSLVGNDKDNNKKLEMIKKQVARAKDKNLSPDAPAEELPLGMSAVYLLDLRHYNPATTATKIKCPILILQGKRDYQVTMEDFNLWKKHLAGKTGVTFKTYPKLHHLFMTGVGEGKSKPSEYQMQEYVAPQVIEDISNWIENSSVLPK